MCSAMVQLLVVSVLLVCAASSPVNTEHGIDIYSFHIKSEVTSRYALTTITSQVANRGNQPQEVNFHIEIPKQAFISKFTMMTGGKEYDGTIKKKAEAQQQYDQAVSQGQSAALVSTVGRKLEEFKTSVTVAAHSKVMFELTYEQLLERCLGRYDLLIKAKPTQAVRDFKIDVKIKDKSGIRFLDITGKLVSRELASIVQIIRSDSESRVLFAPTKYQQTQCTGCGKDGLNGDLLLVYDVNRPTSKGELQIHNGYFVHQFAPSDLPRIPKNVIFIIDKSGSMSGEKMKQTRQALLKILEDIHEDDHFGLITFNHDVSLWRDQLVPATTENLEAARSFVESIDDAGATNINEAVLEGVRMLNRFIKPKDGSASILILLTDGDPTSGITNLQTIQANVKEAIGKRYLFYCLGFGFDVNYKFLEKMALENDGKARRIYTDIDAALQLHGFYEEVATPLLLDIEMKYTGASNLTQTKFSQYYNGTEIVVSGQITDIETFSAMVKAHSKIKELIYEEKPMDKEDTKDSYIFDTYIQKFWAHLTVKQMLEKLIVLEGKEKEEMTQQAVDLSLKYSFVTPLTSMVVTKPEGQSIQVLHKPTVEKEETELPGTPGPPPLTMKTTVRFLVPAAPGNNLPLCFDVELVKGSNYKLLEEQNTGLSMTGEAGAVNQNFKRISIRISNRIYVNVTTKWIDLIDSNKIESFYWVYPSVIYQSQSPYSFSVHKQDDVLTVTGGQTLIQILLKGNGSEVFLWPVIKQLPQHRSVSGLMGQIQVSYAEDPQGMGVYTIMNLHVNGKIEEAIRSQAIDYSKPEGSPVECWLVPPSVFMNQELSDLTVDQL